MKAENNTNVFETLNMIEKKKQIKYSLQHVADYNLHNFCIILISRKTVNMKFER